MVLYGEFSWIGEHLPVRQGAVEGDPPHLAHRLLEEALAALQQTTVFWLGHNISVEPWRGWVSAEYMLFGTIGGDNHNFGLLLRVLFSLQYVLGVLFPYNSHSRVEDLDFI